VNRCIIRPALGVASMLSTRKKRMANPDDILGKFWLEMLDIDETEVDRLLRETPLTGHEGQPVVESERLPELVDMLRRKS
jgi:hypothetical protein